MNTSNTHFVKRDKEAMEALAKALADNYFDVTFGYPLRRETFIDNYKKVFPNENDRSFADAPRVRNVVLVGAGASYAAFGEELFPMASEAIERLRSSLGLNGLQQALRAAKGGFTGPADRIEEEEDRFKQIYGVPNPGQDFESQLAILSMFYTVQQVQGALGRIYSHRYYPHIVFETIAHLLKHRFVDVVVNYNFDEVLDQAIDEELQGGDYRKVLSDGDCEDLSKLVVDEQLKVPLYIKPHGTISHKSTLRFTKDAYIGMPRGLLAFTQKILLGDTKEDPSQQRDRYHVNLISIGFAFTSIELIEMLKGHDRLNVFHFNVAGKERESTLASQVRKIGPQVRQYFIGIDSGRNGTASGARGAYPTIQKAVTELFETTRKRFDRRYDPRGLDRHWIIHDLLFSPNPPPLNGNESSRTRPAGSGVRVPKHDRYYFLARLYVELTIALAKGNGRIDLSTLVGTRVGVYFREWGRVEPGGGVSLREICREMKLISSEGFRDNVFTVSILEKGAAASNPWIGIKKEAGAVDKENLRKVEGKLSEALAEHLWEMLQSVLLQIDDREFQAHLRSEFLKKDDVVRHLTKLVNSDAHDLAPRFSPDALLLLNKVSPSAVIHTHLGMITRFMELVDNPEWDLLLSVSEQGKVLRKLERHLVRKYPRKNDRHPAQIRRRASIVVAESPHSPILDDRLRLYGGDDGLLIGDAYRLPYWAHNDHMVIVLRMGVHLGMFEPLGAIAFRKNGLESRINPVFMENEDDLDLLVNTYFGTVVKAQGYMRVSKDGTRGGVLDVNFEKATSTRLELSTKWWKSMRLPRSADQTGMAEQEPMPPP
jgi:hypothetical protein